MTERRFKNEMDKETQQEVQTNERVESFQEKEGQTIESRKEQALIIAEALKKRLNTKLEQEEKDALDMAVEALRHQKAGKLREAFFQDKKLGLSRKAMFCSICMSGEWHYTFDKNTKYCRCPHCGAILEVWR